MDLFKKMEEGVEFSESEKTPILRGKPVNIAYLLILRTGGMQKSYTYWEEMPVNHKICQAFKNHFMQASMCLECTVVTYNCT